MYERKEMELWEHGAHRVGWGDVTCAHKQGAGASHLSEMP
jgi:hypothetical protein